jgi:hypothetical protein
VRFSAAQRIDPSSGIPGLNCFLADGDLYKELAWADIARMTPCDLLVGPYVFRFDLPAGRAYFTENEGAFLRLQDQGKTVLWLHELFEAWRRDLIRQGLPPATSLYLWPLKEVRFWLDAFWVFPGARIVPNPLEASQ